MSHLLPQHPCTLRKYVAHHELENVVINVILIVVVIIILVNNTVVVFIVSNTAEEVMLICCVYIAGAATQTGKAVGALQDLLPNARVLYSSATGASEPNNLGYMYRLGAAGFDHMKDMIETLNRYPNVDNLGCNVIHILCILCSQPVVIAKGPWCTKSLSRHRSLM